MTLSPKVSFILNKSERQAFNCVCKEGNDVSTLADLQPNSKNYQLVTDSRNYAVWYCITPNCGEKSNTGWIFLYKINTSTNQVFNFDWELLAAYLSVLDFCYLIEGCQVLLLTDHKKLCGAFYSPNTVKSS